MRDTNVSDEVLKLKQKGYKCFERSICHACGYEGIMGVEAKDIGGIYLFIGLLISVAWFITGDVTLQMGFFLFVGYYIISKDIYHFCPYCETKRKVRRKIF